MNIIFWGLIALAVFNVISWSTVGWIVGVSFAAAFIVGLFSD